MPKGHEVTGLGGAPVPHLLWGFGTVQGDLSERDPLALVWASKLSTWSVYQTLRTCPAWASGGVTSSVPAGRSPNCGLQLLGLVGRRADVCTVSFQTSNRGQTGDTRFAT